ncbi:MAG: hypothetical protein ACM3P0_16765 [Acidobacteriota bacterium]
MKTSNLILSLMLILGFSLKTSLAQDRQLIFGAEGAYYKPVGTLNERFKPTNGGAFYLGLQTSEKWTWLVKGEYLKFDKINPERLSLNRTVTVDGTDREVTFPMEKLKMRLEIAGFGLDTKYNLIRTGLFETNVDAGFGFYRWTFHRDGLDSLSADVASNSGSKTVYYSMKKALPISQQDWSGGFNAGVEVIITPFYPVALSFSASYKNIVGELYPSLELDMENISTFQMFDLKAGIRIKL